MIRGDIVQSPLSRFVREIPRELIDMGEDDMKSPKPSFSGMGMNPDMRDAILGKAYAPKPSFGRAFPAGSDTDEVSFGRSFDASRDNTYTHKSTYKNPYLSASKPQEDAARLQGRRHGKARQVRRGNREGYQGRRPGLSRDRRLPGLGRQEDARGLCEIKKGLTNSCPEGAGSKGRLPEGIKKGLQVFCSPFFDPGHKPLQLFPFSCLFFFCCSSRCLHTV